jgi:hypothetical protein
MRVLPNNGIVVDIRHVMASFFYMSGSTEEIWEMVELLTVLHKRV